MANLHHAHRGKVSAYRSQISVVELFPIISSTGRRLQKRPANSRQTAVMSSDNRHQQAKLRRLRDLLESEEAAYHQLPNELCAARETLVSIEEEFSALAADYYSLANGRRRCVSDTNDKQKPKRERAKDFCEAFQFHQP